MRRLVSSHVMHLSRSCRTFSFTLRPASTVGFKITILLVVSVLLLFTWEFNCSNGEQRHTDLLAWSEENRLLQHTKPFYALNVAQTNVHWLSATAVLLSHIPLPKQLSDHMVSMDLPKQSLPHAHGNHTPVMQPILWLQDLVFTSLLGKPFPECFILLTRS